MIKTKHYFLATFLLGTFLALGFTQNLYSYTEGEKAQLRSSLEAMKPSLLPVLKACYNIDAKEYLFATSDGVRPFIVIRQLCPFVDEEVGAYGE